MKYTKAFTVMSVIIVLGIISILVTVGLPGLSISNQIGAQCALVENDVKNALKQLSKYYILNETFNGVTLTASQDIELDHTYTGETQGVITGQHPSCERGVFTYNSANGQFTWN